MSDQTTLVPINEFEKSLANFTDLKDTRKMLSLSAGFITATYREYKSAETRYKATGLPEAKEDRDHTYQIAVKAGELRLWTEVRVGEIIKQEQEAGRLTKQGGDRRSKKQSNTAMTDKLESIEINCPRKNEGEKKNGNGNSDNHVD